MASAGSPRQPSVRPVDFMGGPWPHGSIQAPTGQTHAGDLYAAEQLIQLIRDVIARRQQRGLRRSQLAELAGLRPNTVSDLENGQTWPDVRTLGRIAWALEADLEFVPRQSLRRREP